MNITKFEEKVIEIIDNSNFFKICKEHNNCNSPSIDGTECSTSCSYDKYYYSIHTDEIRKLMQFSLYGETTFNFSVSADTYDELFSLTFKILKSYITSVSKTKEETSEEGKGE